MPNIQCHSCKFWTKKEDLSPRKIIFGKCDQTLKYCNANHTCDIARRKSRINEARK